MMDPDLADDDFELIGLLSLVFCFCSLVFVLAQCGKDRQPRTNTVGETRVNGGAAQKTFYGNAKGTPTTRRSPSSPSLRHRKGKTPSQWSNANHMSPKSLACEPVVSHRNSPTTGGHSHRSGLHKPRKGKSHDPNNMSASKKRNQKRSPDMKPAMPQTDPTQKESKKSVKEQQSTLLISATAGTVKEAPTQRESQRTQMATAVAQPDGASVAGAPKSKSQVVDPAKSEPQLPADIPETTHAPAPRRDLKRDRSLALKALVNYKEKHEISERSKRKRDEEKSARQKEANSEPEIRNHEEKGVMLEEEDGGTPHEKEEDFDNPNDGGPVAPPPPAPPPPPPPPPPKSPSRSFPTVDTPDIPPTDAGKPKPVVRNSEKEDSGSDSEGSDEKSEKPTEKKVVIQGTIFTPDDQRQFKPISDIPADDLTVKRESSKKKKKKKRKSKKKKKAKSGKKPKPNRPNHDES